MPDLLTIGQLVAKLSVPRHRVQYLLDHRGIKPAGRVGTYRMYPPGVVSVLRVELERIEQGKRRIKAA